MYYVVVYTNLYMDIDVKIINYIPPVVIKTNYLLRTCYHICNSLYFIT